ncbi:MAG TPA: acyl carrier protein [Desulfomicrobiaceae bacterium]|nr:acyl carrier protein [Desulfomicrobiaceae bacterium]
MNTLSIREAILAALVSVAPEIDPDEVGDDTDLREEYDLDSFDYMNFLTGIQTRCGVLISEADAGKMLTVGKCVKFVEKRK